MSQPEPDLTDLYLFDDASPFTNADGKTTFKSECPPDKKIKVDDLFSFRRGRGDLHVSIAAALIALFFLMSFWSQTGWENRKLPDNLSQYTAHQFGLTELEGRVTRLGRILKQSWVGPMLCLLILVPTALWNAYQSYKVNRWRKRFLLPTSARYEFSKYLAALEFVAYFIVYTVMVPVLGYLVSTLIFGCFLPWRLGYRGARWLATSFAVSFIAVLLFRTMLQIKTPGSIWLYDQLPSVARAFMLTYF